MNVTIADTIRTGLNNPDCAFYVGQWFGMWLALKFFIFFAVAYYLFRLLDKVMLEPAAEWTKNKIFNRK